MDENAAEGDEYDGEWVANAEADEKLSQGQDQNPKDMETFGEGNTGLGPTNCEYGVQVMGSTAEEKKKGRTPGVVEDAGK